MLLRECVIKYSEMFLTYHFFYNGRYIPNSFTIDLELNCYLSKENVIIIPKDAKLDIKIPKDPEIERARSGYTPKPFKEVIENTIPKRRFNDQYKRFTEDLLWVLNGLKIIKYGVSYIIDEYKDLYTFDKEFNTNISFNSKDNQTGITIIGENLFYVNFKSKEKEINLKDSNLIEFSPIDNTVAQIGKIEVNKSLSLFK